VTPPLERRRILGSSLRAMIEGNDGGEISSSAPFGRRCQFLYFEVCWHPRLLLGCKLKSSTWLTFSQNLPRSTSSCFSRLLLSHRETRTNWKTIDPERSEHASHRRHLLHVARGKHSLLSLDTDQRPSAAGVSLRYRRSRPQPGLLRNLRVFCWYSLIASRRHRRPVRKKTFGDSLSSWGLGHSAT
jgi:hypothetical protein